MLSPFFTCQCVCVRNDRSNAISNTRVVAVYRRTSNEVVLNHKCENRCVASQVREAIAKASKLEEELQRHDNALEHAAIGRPAKRIRRKEIAASQEQPLPFARQEIAYHYTNAGGLRTRLQAAFPGLQRFPRLVGRYASDVLRSRFQ